MIRKALPWARWIWFQHDRCLYVQRRKLHGESGRPLTLGKISIVFILPKWVWYNHLHAQTHPVGIYIILYLYIYIHINKEVAKNPKQNKYVTYEEKVWELHCNQNFTTSQVIYNGYYDTNIHQQHRALQEAEIQMTHELPAVTWTNSHWSFSLCDSATPLNRMLEKDRKLSAFI